jgi:signal recognition particle subunit SRP54
VFDTLSDRLEKVFTSLRGKGRLSENDINTTCREIRIALLEADVALPAVKSFIGAVKERASGAEVARALNPAQQVVKIVNEELITILGGETRRLRFAKNPPTVILLAGLQGAGKTTLAGKLGKWLGGQGHTPMLIAADLQRPNAVNQLQVVGQQAGVAVFAPHPGATAGIPDPAVGPPDPVAVARAGVEEARRRQHDIVIVDTAGRLGIDADMMAQAAAIRDAVSPDEILFVVDAMIGQDAVTTAEAFRDQVGFSGVVLSKLDSDARGGAALSVRFVTGQPILFASTGEKLTDFDVFHPERMASRILGMGDMLTLIEQAEATFDADEAEKMAGKIASGNQFTLEDFLEQMLAIRKMGPISNILGMLPGMGQFKEQLAGVDDKDIDRTAAIIRSMTPGERAEPKLINGSRRSRIAKGSGVAVYDVNQLVERFFEARKMMSQMANGGMPGMPGIPGMPGARKARKVAAKKGKQAKGGQGKRSRNPAQQRARTPQPGRVAGGGPNGLPGGLPPGAGPAGLPQFPTDGSLPDLTKLKFPKK